MVDFEPKHLQLWTMPANYCGEIWPGYYSAGVGQSRDSDALERANFDAMLKAIGGESETVTVVRESHWAVGWVEWIAIHTDDGAALQIADQIKGDLADYPVVDESLWSEYEDNDCSETWANCYDPSDRLAYLKDHVGRDSLIRAGWRDIRAATRKDGWGYAANILPCPSDLLH